MTRRLDDDPPEINLIPMLDMVSLLIQLLLVNAQFGVFAEIPADLGAPSDQQIAGVQLRVDVSTSGFGVGWTEPGGPEARTVPCLGGSCAAPESWDHAALAELARKIKGLHPAEAQVQLVVAPDVSFEVVARAMDALRGSESGPLFPDVVLGG
ncbi:MAG: biopolymer transporter ExbD [Myxococcota bacterium]